MPSGRRYWVGSAFFNASSRLWPLRTALSTGRSRKGSLVACIRARIEPLGGVELEIAPREAIREPVNLDT